MARVVFSIEENRNIILVLTALPTSSKTTPTFPLSLFRYFVIASVDINVRYVFAIISKLREFW